MLIDFIELPAVVKTRRRRVSRCHHCRGCPRRHVGHPEAGPRDLVSFGGVYAQLVTLTLTGALLPLPERHLGHIRPALLVANVEPRSDIGAPTSVTADATHADSTDSTADAHLPCFAREQGVSHAPSFAREVRILVAGGAAWPRASFMMREIRAQQETGRAVQGACRMNYAGLGAPSCGKGIAPTDLCR
jgi:hypothetical protein